MGAAPLASFILVDPFAGTDIADNIYLTTTVLPIGTSVTSSIGLPAIPFGAGFTADRDYIKVSLVAGQTYTFSLQGVGFGALSDPFLELRSATDNILVRDDNGGIGLNAFLMYRPVVSGDYYLVVSGVDTSAGATVGDYTLAGNVIRAGSTSPTAMMENGKPHLSLDEAAIQLTRTGASWAAEFNTPAIVTYAYRATAPETMPAGVNGFSRFSAAQILATEAILKAWSDVANISFVRVGVGTTGIDSYSDNATILFSNYDSSTVGSLGFAFLPDEGLPGQQGDVWIYAGGTDNYILLHEIGHALGLEHPGNYDSGTTVGRITYAGNASYFADSQMFTVMSYFYPSETGAWTQAVETMPALHDIAAIQRLYGANWTTRTGDTVYGFNSNTGVPGYTLTAATQAARFTIWDAGGNDTLDLSGYTEHAVIDLREESFSSAGPDKNATTGPVPPTDPLGSTGGGLPVPLPPSPAKLNISIARGAVIENASGGAGNDILQGNATNNILRGNAGKDTLRGGDGNDRLEGGLGDDLLDGGRGGDVMNGGPGIDTVTYETSIAGITVNLQTGAASNGDASGDVLVSVENLTGSASADQIVGSSVANILLGLAGNDVIRGVSGNDVLDGGDGDDWLDGGAGGDRISGGTGFDVAVYTSSGAAVTIDLAATIQSGGDATGDRLSGVEGLIGSRFSDRLRGDAQANLLSGDGGNDTLTGRGGADTLTGGNGNDTFYFADADGIATDIITDFDDFGDDVIQLSMAGILTFNDILSRMSQVGADVLINLDTTDILLQNTTLASMAADDFLFGPGG